MLEKNIARLRDQDPDLVDKLEAVQDLDSLAWCETRKGEPNLCDGGSVYLHSNYSAKKECEEWFKSLDLSAAKVLYVYGLGTGEAHVAIKPWLEADHERQVVFLEDDLRVLRRVMETERGAALLEDPQVLLVYMHEELEQVCLELAAYFIGLLFATTALPTYARERAEKYDRVKLQLMHHSAYMGFAGTEFMEYGVRFFNNFYRNMQKLPECVGCRGFYGKFKGVPAVICGAGPSLNKNFEVLRGLSDRALIFAGGSAINALSSLGLWPHLGGSVDPNPTQYERMKQHTGKRLPVFIKGRTYWKAMDALDGPHVYLAGNNLYPITDWFEERLGIEEPIAKEGYNVLHLLIDLAVRMGCDPIIFVGMDLAYTDMHAYAGKVLDQTEVSKEEITSGSDLNHNAFLRTDIHGKPVYTLWKWVAESEYTSRLAAEQKAVRFVNCTEGGLGFAGIENIPLQAVAEELSQSFNIEAMVKEAVATGSYSGISREDVFRLYDELDESLSRCLELCREIIDQLEELKTGVKKNRTGIIAKASERAAELQKKLSEELAFTQILDPVNKLRSIIYERKFEQIERSDKARTELQKMLKRCENNQLEVQCFYECAEVNRAILRKAREPASSESSLPTS